METVQDIKYKVFYSCIVCLLLFKNNNHQTNKTLAKSSDGAGFLYCLWNWLSDEKKELKQLTLGVTTRNPPRTSKMHTRTSSTALEQEIRASTGLWYPQMTQSWFLHCTAITVFFSYHDAIFVSLVQKIIHNIPQTYGSPAVRCFSCK